MTFNQKEYQKQYYKENREREMSRALKWRQGHKEATAVHNKRVYDKTKSRFFEMYGSRCNYCGETIKEFLTIEHKNGQVGKKKETSYKAYRLAILEYNPMVYEVLCMNCNFSMGKYGYCPHKQENQK